MTSRRLLAIMFGAVIALVTACGGASHGAPEPLRQQLVTGRLHVTEQQGIVRRRLRRQRFRFRQHPAERRRDHDSDNSGGPSDGDGNV